MIRWMSVAFVFAVMVAGFAPQADATANSGQRLLSRCTSPYQDDKVYCLAYIAGLSDALREKKHMKAFPACVPDSVERGELLAVAVSYLRRGGQNENARASRLLIKALSEAFPC